MNKSTPMIIPKRKIVIMTGDKEAKSMYAAPSVWYTVHTE